MVYNVRISDFTPSDVSKKITIRVMVEETIYFFLLNRRGKDTKRTELGQEFG